MRIEAFPAAAEVWRLAGPATLQQLLMALVFVADRAIVGHAGPNELASLHVSTSIAWTATSLLGAVAIGALATVGRRTGAREGHRAAAEAENAIAFAGGLALVLTIPLYLLRDPLVSALGHGSQGPVAALAGAYLAIVLPAVPAAAVAAAAAACLHARGDARRPLWAGAAATTVNVALSVALVFGAGPLPALGVRGAAIGTAAGFVVQAAVLLVALRGDLSWRWPRSGGGLRAALVRVTLPALVEKVTFHAGYLGYVAMIAFLGGAAMAANQALLAIEALAFPIAEGFGVAAAALSAQKMGAGRPEAALRTARSAARMAAIGLAIFGMSLALAPGAWMSAFTGDAGVASLGRASIYAAAAAQPFMAFAVVATAALRGAGRTSTALAITLVCGVGVRLGATWLLSMTLGMGLAGAWLASALDWMSQALLVTVVLERGSLHGSFASDVALVPRGNPAC